MANTADRVDPAALSRIVSESSASWKGSFLLGASGNSKTHVKVFRGLWRYLGERLAILAVQQIAHRLPPRRVRFTHTLALVGVHAALRRGGSYLGGTALRAAVGETGFTRLQLELLRA